MQDCDKTPMKGRILLIALSVFIVISALPFAISDDADGAGEYHIKGYVVECMATGNVPLSGVEVSITEQSAVVSIDKTDETGEFDVIVGSNSDLRIKFSAEGYTLRFCMGVTNVGTEDMLLDLENADYDASTGTYTITSGPEGLQCAVMMATEGTVVGTVIYSEGSVEGATVTLTSKNDPGIKHSGTTDSHGRYSIKCSTGDYTLKVECKGFESSEPIDVSVSSGTTPVPQTSLKKAELSEYMGLDVAHVLMIVGVILGIMLALLAWHLSRRLATSPESASIIDDSEEEEEEVKHA